MNTKIEYLYRDADNYKQRNVAIVEGELSTEDRERILACRHEGLWFIPSQVGLDEERLGEYDNESDHVWFELADDAFSSTDELTTCFMMAHELVEAFEDADGQWDEMRALDQLWEF